MVLTEVPSMTLDLKYNVVIFECADTHSRLQRIAVLIPTIFNFKRSLLRPVGVASALLTTSPVALSVSRRIYKLSARIRPVLEYDIKRSVHLVKPGTR